MKDTVEGCTICQEHRDANSPAFLQQYEVPEYPFQVLGSDLFELEGVPYLLTIDCFGKWPAWKSWWTPKVQQLLDTWRNNFVVLESQKNLLVIMGLSIPV